MVFLIHHVFLESLRERTSEICTTVQIYKNFEKDWQNLTHKHPDDWITTYNLIAATSPNRVLTMYDGKLIRNTHMRKAIDGVYHRGRKSYPSFGRAGSALLFRNSMEHLSEYLALQNRIDRERCMVILHTVLGGVSLDVFDHNTSTKTGNKIILNVLGTVRNYGVL